MNKLLLALISALLASAVHAQTTATSPAIGQAVSGNNSTASGTSGTGLRQDGTARTGSTHTATGKAAAGVNSAGQVTGPGTAVIGTTPEKNARTNAQATNTLPPATTATDVPATGGRGEPGSQAEREISKANAQAVREVPGDRLKTNKAAEKARKKKAKAKKADQQGRSENAS
jgi:hypothetical protein